MVFLCDPAKVRDTRKRSSALSIGVVIVFLRQAPGISFIVSLNFL